MHSNSINDNPPRGFKRRFRLDVDRLHGRIFRIAWSPDGRTLASPAEDKRIRLWDVDAGKLRQELEGHSDSVISVAWSPDGLILASGSYDKTIRIWDVETGKLLQILEWHSGPVNSVAWSPDGRTLASGSNDKIIRLWDMKTGQLRGALEGHSDRIRSLAWSPDGRTLASGSEHRTIRLWNVEAGQMRQTLEGHSDAVFSVAWSPDGRALASASEDHTVILWATRTGRLKNIFEGHTKFVTAVSFSFDGRLLASRSHDKTVRIWDCEMYEMVAMLEMEQEASFNWSSSLAFNPKAPILAVLSEKDEAIDIWDLDFVELLGSVPPSRSVHYVNAKVVLLGDTGVGKTGLGLVLVNRPFKPTESTHGRHVWRFESRVVELEDGRGETRETFLWDLAGQPGYRLIHQLHLNEVAVALVVFDARSETDPFAGVRHWDRALRQARRVSGDTTPPIKKILVAARTDRGGISASPERIETVIRDFEFDAYFKTSAKEGWNIAALADAIRSAICWEALPKVSSPELFQRFKIFLIEEKDGGSLLSTAENLYRAFLKSGDTPPETEELYALFEASIRYAEARGLIRRLSFGKFILLEPELLDSYASTLVNAAKEDPGGLGCISEELARAGRFPMPADERLKNEEQEKLLLIATIEDLLRHEIALREPGEDGPYLVFPSQFTREDPDLPDPEGKAVVFTFEGPVLNVYATLAVRLSHSGVFKKKELWKNAAKYTAIVGGTCGMLLREAEEGRGELTLFFDSMASEETRFQFEEFVYAHLQRRALPESIHRRRIFVCSGCGFVITNQLVRLRAERGFNWVDCPVCQRHISLLDREERLAVVPLATVLEMDRAADAERERETKASVLQGKIATNDFDVFIAYNNVDKLVVKQIAERLKERGILPWLDEWNLPPGRMAQQEIERILPNIKAVAIFVGPSGIGPWENVEMHAAITQFVKRKLPVITALLPGVATEPDLPLFLKEFKWVWFTGGIDEPKALDDLEWGITGENPQKSKRY